ncbi:MAG: hypothetical protein KJ995_07875, partial [Candidatus Omnitrophica bacterium]|nr:hypothetical protein [Candidatus Omnitrophota bacterium]
AGRAAELSAARMMPPEFKDFLARFTPEKVKELKDIGRHNLDAEKVLAVIGKTAVEDKGKRKLPKIRKKFASAIRFLREPFSNLLFVVCVAFGVLSVLKLYAAPEGTGLDLALTEMLAAVMLRHEIKIKGPTDDIVVKLLNHIRKAREQGKGLFEHKKEVSKKEKKKEKKGKGFILKGGLVPLKKLDELLKKDPEFIVPVSVEEVEEKVRGVLNDMPEEINADDKIEEAARKLKKEVGFNVKDVLEEIKKVFSKLPGDPGDDNKKKLIKFFQRSLEDEKFGRLKKAIVLGSKSFKGQVDQFLLGMNIHSPPVKGLLGKLPALKDKLRQYDVLYAEDFFEFLDDVTANKDLRESLRSEYIIHEILCEKFGHVGARVLQSVLFPESYPEIRPEGVLAYYLRKFIDLKTRTVAIVFTRIDEIDKKNKLWKEIYSKAMRRDLTSLGRAVNEVKARDEEVDPFFKVIENIEKDKGLDGLNEIKTWSEKVKILYDVVSSNLSDELKGALLFCRFMTWVSAKILRKHGFDVVVKKFEDENKKIVHYFLVIRDSKGDYLLDYTARQFFEYPEFADGCLSLLTPIKELGEKGVLKRLTAGLPAEVSTAISSVPGWEVIIGEEVFKKGLSVLREMLLSGKLSEDEVSALAGNEFFIDITCAFREKEKVRRALEFINDVLGEKERAKFFKDDD